MEASIGKKCADRLGIIAVGDVAIAEITVLITTNKIIECAYIFTDCTNGHRCISCCSVEIIFLKSEAGYTTFQYYSDLSYHYLAVLLFYYDIGFGYIAELKIIEKHSTVANRTIVDTHKAIYEISLLDGVGAA